MDALLLWAGLGFLLAIGAGHAAARARDLPGNGGLGLALAAPLLVLAAGALLMVPAASLDAWLPGAGALMPLPAVGLAGAGALCTVLGLAAWVRPLRAAERHRQSLIAQAARLEALVGQQQEELRRAHARVEHETEERGKAQAVSSGSQELWRTLLNQAPSSILVVDRAGIVVSMSKPLPGTDAALGKSLLAALPGEARQEAERVLARVFASGAAGSYEATMADSVWAHRIGPVRRDGEVVAGVLVATDITEWKRTEEAQRIALEKQHEVERLEQDISLRTQMLHTAAHELFNPLTPMSAQLHLLRVGGLENLTDKQRRSLDMLERNVNRLKLLVNDMRDVGRIQNGRLNLNQEPMALDEVVREVVEAFAEQARGAGVRLEAGPACGLRVEADVQRLGQVAFNFVSNALKFTPAGGSVRIACAAEQGRAVLRVRDSGRGLTPEQMGKLFQPFSQVHDASGMKEKGSGLGLFICKGIAEAHGGKVWVESDGPGKGSCFCLALPLPAAARRVEPVAQA